MAGKQAALALQHRAKVDQTTVIALLGQPLGIARRLGGHLHMHQALLVALQLHQGIFHLLQRRQNTAAVGLPRLHNGGLLRGNLRPVGPRIKNGRRQTGGNAAGHRGPIAQRPQGQRTHPQAARQAQRGEVGPLLRRQIGQRRLHPVLLRLHIRALAQRVGGQAHGPGWRRSRHRGGLRQRRQQSRRGLARQHGQGMLGLPHAGLQAGDLRRRLRQGLARLLGIQTGGQPGLDTPAGHLLGLGLQGQVVLCDAQALLRIAQLDVVQRHLGRQTHMRSIERGLGGGQVFLARLHQIALAPPQVQLPTGIQAHGVAVAGIGHALLAAPRPGAGIQAGQQTGALHIDLGTGLLHGGLGAHDAGVGRQGLLNEGDQLGIAKALPPLGQIQRGGR